MATFWILLLIFSTSSYCGPLRELDGNLPMIDSKNHPLYVDIDVSKFNMKLKDILTKDIPREISEMFQAYIESDNFTRLTADASSEEIRTISGNLVKDIFQQYIQSKDFKQNLLGKMATKFTQDVFERYIGSSEYTDLVNNRTAKEVENLSAVTMDEIKRLNEQIEDLKKITTVLHSETCDDLRGNVKESGVYLIKGSLKSYCDMTTDGGGWTVFQRRIDGSLDFYKYWKDYKEGFGDLNGEFWLGNDKIHNISSSGSYELRIDLLDWDGSTRFAQYRNFKIGNEASNYRLTVSSYSGNAGDGMTYSNGKKFSTRDRDNDGRSNSCAQLVVGAWWYDNCAYSNLNGEYLRGKHSKSGTFSAERGVHWYFWEERRHYSLKGSRMMIRRH